MRRLSEDEVARRDQWVEDKMKEINASSDREEALSRALKEWHTPPQRDK